MTEATIKAMAKELAGEFYEAKRSGKFRKGDNLVKARTLVKDERTGQYREKIVLVPFRKAFPTVDRYVEAWWPFYVETAKQCLVGLLRNPGTGDYMKKCIYDALVEEKEKELKIEAGIIPGQVKRLIQRQVKNDGDE